MTHFILRWELRGAHVHVRVFSASHSNLTHAMNGKLVFSQSEWESLLRCFQDRGEDTILVLPERSAIWNDERRRLGDRPLTLNPP